MNNLNTETFVNPQKNTKFTIWEDDERLMMTCEHYDTINIEINSTDAKLVRLDDLKHIFGLCRENIDHYDLCDVDETEFYIKIDSLGEKRYIIFNEYDNENITVQFLTRGMYIDKSDPHNWVEREDVMELGNEHQLTCKDLYRIKKMCNISD